MHLPLLKPEHSSAPLVWHDGIAITRGDFAHSARRLATRLPDTCHVINLCAGRLNFMLGFVACALRGQTTLLPPNQTAAALQRLQQEYPQHHVLDDSVLAQLTAGFETGPANRNTVTTSPPLLIEADQTVITLFTSGSTGTPQAQTKTWRSLTRTAQLDAQRFTPTPLNLVATVPSQHMFGLQTTVLLPLLGNCAIHDSRPFFPADIRAALEAVPAPRALIITPTHLRACIAGNIVLPEIEFVLSATAPMPVELAQQAETRWRTQVLEIYGSTEAGAMGTRRTTAGEHWQLMPNTRMESVAEGTLFHAPYLPQALLLSDHVELYSSTQFRLLGRATDQIKVAGKRASLGELTHALLKISGVQDGVMFLPPDAERTAALVVAPQLNAAQLLDALAREVDAVFLPRPLVLLKQLPRNEVGKLTQAALLTALRTHESPAS
jgi:acyl-coenzyme A synthetase/AMP-(fatty) acid ligase